MDAQTTAYSKVPKTAKPRQGFATGLGAIAATLGSAVGLGNIWKFPYMTGQNGGAAFILVYLLCLFIAGLPVMLAEFIIGRRSKANAVRSFKKLAPGTSWYLTGVAGVTSAVVIMFFYSCVAGWVYAYIFKAASGALAAVDPAQTPAVFEALTASPLIPLLWQWVVLAVVGTVIIAGVQNGIERVAKTVLPILFVLLIVCDIRALTLPGAAAGVNFLFRPDFSKITPAVFLAALGLSFFKMSVAMGVMTTYGSYMGPEDNLPASMLKVALSDTLVSIMAGLAIFPAVFAFGYQADAGPSLLFITIPMVFNSMPLGQLFLTLFFLLAAIAATGAMISLMEVPVAYLTEENNWPRTKATLVSVLVVAAFGALATFSTSILSHVQLWGRTFFDFFDFITSSIFMPIAGVAISLFAGWVLTTKVIVAEGSNNGQLNNQGFLSALAFILKFVTPVAVTVVLLSGLGFIKL
ncbi:MAG: sodium-dependent transporter [Firmicutes bacterium]|nr:sodium-dependent transporter [Bacillota bacterium]